LPGQQGASRPAQGGSCSCRGQVRQPKGLLSPNPTKWLHGAGKPSKGKIFKKF